jgi:protein TonB
MMNAIELFETAEASVRPEQRKLLPPQQTMATQLSLLLHVVLIGMGIMLNRQGGALTSPRIIDFTVVTAELPMEKPNTPAREAMVPIKLKTPALAVPVAAQPQVDSPKPHAAAKAGGAEKPSRPTGQQQKKSTTTEKVENSPQPMPLSTAQPMAREPPVAPFPPAPQGAAGSSDSSTRPDPDSPPAPAAGSNAALAHSQATTGNDGNGAKQAEQHYLRQNFEHIRSLIMRNLTFPAAARKLGWTGKIRVSFIIREDGRVEDINIVSGSGHEVLDRNVLAAIRRTAPFPEPPVKAQLILPIVYSLK